MAAIQLAASCGELHFSRCCALKRSGTVTLVPEAIYGGSEERSEREEKSPLVESVGNLTSMLSPSTEIEPRR